MADRYWVGGTGTWNTTSTTNWSTQSGGSGGASVPTTNDDIFFDQASTYTVTMTGALVCRNITVSAGTVTFATGTSPTLGISGSMAITAGTTTWNSTGLITFNSTTSQTIQSGGTVFDCSMTISGAGGTKTLLDNLTLGAGTTNRTFQLTSGTFALDSYTLTTHLFVSSSSNTRTLSFGTGKISLKAVTTSTIWNTSTITGLTVTGSKDVEFIGGAGGTTFTITPATAISEANSFNFNIAPTAGTITFTGSSRVNNLTFANNSYTVTNVALTIYGNLTVGGTNVTLSGGTAVWGFSATSGTKTITTNGDTLDFPITFNGIGGTWQITDTLTVGVTSRAITLTNGTVDFNNQTIAGTHTYSKSTGTITVSNLSDTASFTMTGGTFILGSNITTGAFGLTAGTVQLVSYAYTTPALTWSGLGTKSFDFGTSGKFVVDSSTGGSKVTGTISGFSITGTYPLIEVTGGGTGITKTIDMGPQTESTAMSLRILETSGSVSYTFSNPIFKDLVIDSSSGTIIGAVAPTIYGSYTFGTTYWSSGASLTQSTSVWNFRATSGSHTITTNGKLQVFPITFNGAGGTWVLQDALTIQDTRALTLQNGTLDLNGYTLTTGTFTTGAGTKNLTFNGGILTVVGASFSAIATGFTSTAGSAVGTINMTSASDKTFGGTQVYAAKLNQGGAGKLTISQSNTFEDITNSYSSIGATTISIGAGFTITLNDFTATGAPGNILTLNSNSTGTRAILSKSSGIVSVDYMSIRDSEVTGGASWYAGDNSTSGGNNLGWIFTGVPVIGESSAFLMMF